MCRAVSRFLVSRAREGPVFEVQMEFEFAGVAVVVLFSLLIAVLTL